MTEMFQYSTTGERPIGAGPAPIWPDFSPSSAMSRKMIECKQRNGPDFWPTMREVFAHDLKTLPIERMLAWASVWTVPLLSNGRFSQYIHRALADSIYHPRLDLKHAISQPIGAGVNAEDLQTLRVLDDIPATMNRITMYGHLDRAGGTAVLTQLDTIVEIGAGIGDMADVCRKLGFRGRYVTYDFPELLEMQSRYHRLPGMALAHDKNIYTSNVDHLSAADLVICTYSLTEMPLDLREQLLHKLKDSRRWLCAYSNKILGFDNDAWVKEKMIPMLTSNGMREHTITPIEFMPWDGGCNYLIVKTFDL